MHKKLYIILITMLSGGIELVSAQIALPVFQAIQKSVASHPGFSVTGLLFDNHVKYGTGDESGVPHYISIPWSSALKAYTADDSSAFTVSIRAYLPAGPQYYRRNDYYTSPSHTMRGAYYYDGGNRIISGIYNSSGAVGGTDLEYGTTTRATDAANHTTTWSGKYSENIQSIYYDSKYWYWIGYRGTADPSTGVYTSSSTGVKLWMKENGNNDAYNPNKSMSDVLVESSASGNYDFIRVTYSSLSDMTSGNSGTIVSTGLGNTTVGAGSDYGPGASYSTNCMNFYLNGSLVKAHGLTNSISGTTSGTGYLGRSVYDFGGESMNPDKGPYTRLHQVTEWTLINYCNPSSVSSLHSSQGSSDLRSWAAEQGKLLAIYYSLTNAITDGDTVEDLSGNGRNGTANGF